MSTVIYGKDSLTGSNDPVNITDQKLHIAQYVWDTNTLSWIRQTGSSGTGTDVTVTNFPAVQQVEGSLSIAPIIYTKRYEQVSELLAYLGEADVGSSEGASVWRIQQLTFNAAGDVSNKFANGSVLFNQVWANRAALSYT